MKFLNETQTNGQPTNKTFKLKSIGYNFSSPSIFSIEMIQWKKVHKLNQLLRVFQIIQTLLPLFYPPSAALIVWYFFQKYLFLVSISSTFYEQFLFVQIPKV